MSLQVFYVDDEVDLCELFQDHFASPEVQVQIFTDGKLAVKEAKKNAPDLIFLDYRLPGVNGDTIAQQMPPGIPIHLVTGEIAIETTYKFASVIGKPFKIEDVRKIITSKLAEKSN